MHATHSPEKVPDHNTSTQETAITNPYGEVVRPHIYQNPETSTQTGLTGIYVVAPNRADTPSYGNFTQAPHSYQNVPANKAPDHPYENVQPNPYRNFDVVDLKK